MPRFRHAFSCSFKRRHSPLGTTKNPNSKRKGKKTTSILFHYLPIMEVPKSTFELSSNFLPASECYVVLFFQNVRNGLWLTYKPILLKRTVNCKLGYFMR